MNRTLDLRIEHGKLLQKALEDIQINGNLNDRKQQKLLIEVLKSSAYAQGYEEGYKEACSDIKNKS